MMKLLSLLAAVLLLIAGMGFLRTGREFWRLSTIFRDQTAYFASVVIGLMGLALLAAAWFVAPLTLTAG
ncbi:hypothetical protein [Herbaspirillum huttiense]|uniref:Uncharacterized protein n=1 Tax=Herbaspirillum huttiense subsp. lycopersici TaxID=3074428 RepID=A0ABU2EG34_9BURK|nr:hypothetical protein [Herbaspirillum huttiense]MDR9847086.1 hypothetical protein [Herbaspirillum huttiense SE1]